MKTPQEWLDWLARETNDPQQKGRTHEVLLTEESISTIQQDAFESGRVSARGESLDIMRNVAKERDGLARVLGECVSSIEELDWSYYHNSLDVLERRAMALKHARQVLGISDRKEFLGTLCTRCGSYHPAYQKCLMTT